MPLELRKNKDGTFRPVWYGRFKVNNQRQCVKLKAKVSGTPPATLREMGDAAFERSRAVAQFELDEHIRNASERRDVRRMAEKIYEMKSGEKVRDVLLVNLADAWEKVPRKRKPNPRYMAQCRSVLNRFVEFMNKHYPTVTEISQVNRDTALDFLQAEENRGVSAKTWNDVLKLLRASYKHLLSGGVNPFNNIPTKDTETVFRKPFTPAELQAILEVARDDDFIRPIIITGMCTAMRRGDCCLLKWEDVDLKKGFITVKTSKTGQTVDIPIFPILLDELQRTRRTRSPFAFPQQAEMYRTNPDGITWRVKKVLEKALVAEDEVDVPQLAEVSQDVILQKGETYLDELPVNEKSERMRTVFGLYMDGSSVNQLVAKTGISKGCISNYLKEMEQACECQIIRGKNVVRKPSVALQKKREHGQRAASVRDFHSFRVTWVTLALNAGVPLELVQKVTGHKTAEIVMKHYFQPGREDFRNALQSAMPAMLMEKAVPYSVQKDPRDLMDETVKIIKGITSKNWRERKKAALDKLANLDQWFQSSVITE